MPFPTFTTGEVLTAADMNAVGLWLVKTQTIGTTVASVTVSDVFTTTYNEYLIRYSVVSQSANATVGYSHNVTSGSNYFAVGQEMEWGNATVTGIGPAGATSSRVGRYVSGLGRVIGQIKISMPASATRKFGEAWCAAAGYGYHGQIQMASSAIDTGFTLAPSTGTWSGGSIFIYGYREA
jgi:hypothetical protein